MALKLVSLLRLGISVLPFIGASAQARVDAAAPPPDWEATLAQDTAEAYARFILENPDSDRLDEALARIELLGDTPVRLASAVRHSDLPDSVDGILLGAPGAERLMNI